MTSWVAGPPPDTLVIAGLDPAIHSAVPLGKSAGAGRAVPRKRKTPAETGAKGIVGTWEKKRQRIRPQAA